MKNRESQLKKIDKILAMKKPAKYRAIRDLVLELNPLIAKEHEVFMKEIETIREQQDNDDATSKGGTLRYSMSVPTSIVTAIREFEPDFLIYDKKKYKTKDATNKEVRKLMKVFPEYAIPRSFVGARR